MQMGIFIVQRRKSRFESGRRTHHDQSGAPFAGPGNGLEFVPGVPARLFVDRAQRGEDRFRSAASFHPCPLRGHGESTACAAIRGNGMPSSDDDRLRFPSGRTVGNCRKDAKKLAHSRGVALSTAQDEVARTNGATKPWHHAIAALRSAATIIVPGGLGVARPMTADDVRAVLEKHWELTHFGMGPNSQNLKEAAGHYGRAIELGHQQLFNALDECNKACRFLRHVEKRKTINRKWTSYGLKHEAEGFVRSLKDRPVNAYVANGAFICAALHLGFEIQGAGLTSPNVYFNMSSRSPVFQWRRLVSDRSSQLYYQTKRDRLAALSAQLGAETKVGSF